MSFTAPQLKIIEPQDNYQLIASGGGEKLEKFGKYVLRRPDPQALWLKDADETVWSKHDAFFNQEEKDGWVFNSTLPKQWLININQICFVIKPSVFKHVGVFPEQIENWQWLKNVIKKEKRQLNVLNLFAYTGGASLACVQAGAKVCHVDATKSAVAWAKENAKANGLAEVAIRWLVDDAMAFVNRELKRSNKYDGIILDPPIFGRGPKGQVWKIEKDILPLLERCYSLLGPRPAFFLLNGYAAGYSALAYGAIVSDLFATSGGVVECGELAIRPTIGKNILPAGIFARWQSHK
jgi:23S rRNA (cytosine1962-C5)-methyltransferase